MSSAKIEALISSGRHGVAFLSVRLYSTNVWHKDAGLPGDICAYIPGVSQREQGELATALTCATHARSAFVVASMAAH